MTELSGYELETLREGREFTLYRGWQHGNPLPRTSIHGRVIEDYRSDHIHVEDVVVRQLEVPPIGARLEIERHHRRRKQRCAWAQVPCV